MRKYANISAGNSEAATGFKNADDMYLKVGGRHVVEKISERNKEDYLISLRIQRCILILIWFSIKNLFSKKSEDYINCKIYSV